MRWQPVALIGCVSGALVWKTQTGMGCATTRARTNVWDNSLFHVCGICNGPGPIYTCTCQDIQPGVCDCSGTPDVDEDGICDDVDSCIGNVDSDGDGICDGTDKCDGVEDECGVCNGPGAIYTCGCNDIPEGDCDSTGTSLMPFTCVDGVVGKTQILMAWCDFNWRRRFNPTPRTHVPHGPLATNAGLRRVAAICQRFGQPT